MPVEMPLMGLQFSSMSIVAPASSWSYCERSQLLSFFMLLCDHGNCHMHLFSTPAVLKFTHHFCSKILSWLVPELVTAATVVSLSPAVTGATTESRHVGEAGSSSQHPEKLRVPSKGPSDGFSAIIQVFRKLSLSKHCSARIPGCGCSG